jgi:hypothetical protein
VSPRRPPRTAVLIAVGAALLAGCGGGQNVLRPESPQQDRISDLFWIMLGGWRTAIGAALATCVVIVFLAGSMDRADVTLGLSYERQIWVYRVLVWVLPAVVLFVTLRVCRELRAGEQVERRRRAAERAARLDV